MEKALRILDDACKSLESEIRIWSKHGKPKIVEKYKLELEQVKDAMKLIELNK